MECDVSFGWGGVGDGDGVYGGSRVLVMGGRDCGLGGGCVVGWGRSDELMGGMWELGEWGRGRGVWR